MVLKSNQIEPSVVIPPHKLQVLKGRTSVLYALLGLVKSTGSNRLRVTYDSLVKPCGYKNRSGVWKNIKWLEQLGIVTKDGKDLIVDLGWLFLNV